MCFKRKNSKNSKRIKNISNKQIAQYIVADLEKMHKEESKSKNTNDLMTNSKKNEINIEKKQNSFELIKFSYNYIEAIPTYLQNIDVLNEKYILRNDEINIENI